MESESVLLKEIRANRQASAAEHAALRELVQGQAIVINEIKEDLRGNKERGIDGLIYTVKKHSKLLRPIELLNKYPKASLLALFILAHVLAYASFKGIDKLLTLF